MPTRTLHVTGGAVNGVREGRVCIPVRGSHQRLHSPSEPEPSSATHCPFLSSILSFQVCLIYELPVTWSSIEILDVTAWNRYTSSFLLSLARTIDYSGVLTVIKSEAATAGPEL
jgi:hypothetical protein